MDDYLMMIKMMMIFFYGGPGTKCTESQNSNAKQDDRHETKRPRTNKLTMAMDDKDKDKAPDNGTDNTTSTTTTNNTNNRLNDKDETREPNDDDDDNHGTTSNNSNRSDADQDWHSKPWMEPTDGNRRRTTTTPPPTTAARRGADDDDNDATRMARTWTTDGIDRWKIFTTTRTRTRTRSTTQGRMMMMGMTAMQSATGTLDRKTSQASPAACLYNNQEQKTLDD
jgi:hypothetical protein